jgi:glutathione S-transferase
MPNPPLTLAFKYLPVRGDAEGVRALLRLRALPDAGHDIAMHETVTFAKGAGDARPFPTVLSPVLEVYSKPLAAGAAPIMTLQHAAPIARFLASLAGVAGSNIADAARIDMIATEAHKMEEALLASDWYSLAADGSLPAGVPLQAARSLFFRTAMLPRLLALERQLVAGSRDGAGGGASRYFVGGALSFADIAVGCMLERLNSEMPGCLWQAAPAEAAGASGARAEQPHRTPAGRCSELPALIALAEGLRSQLRPDSAGAGVTAAASKTSAASSAVCG